MHENSDNPDSSRKKASNFRATCKRLFGYAFRHKSKMAVLVFFSFVSAGSLSTMVVGTVLGIDIVYATDENAQKRIDDYSLQAAKTVDQIDRVTGWHPDFEGIVESTITSMREDKRRALRSIAMLIVAITLIGGTARFIQEYFAGIIGASIVMDLRQEMYDSIISLSHDFFEQRASGTIMSRFSNDVGTVNSGILNVFVLLFREPFKVLIPLGLALLISPKMLLLILLFMTPLIVLFSIMARKVKRRVRRSLDKNAVVSTILMESIRGITVVKGFRMEERERALMSTELRKLRKQLVKYAKLDAITAPLTELVLVMGAGALLIMGEQVIASENLDPKDFAVLAASIVLIIEPMRKLAKVNNKLQSSVVAAERVFEYIDYKPSVQEKADAKDIPNIQDAISFEHVDFSYDGTVPVLRDVSFRVGKGEMVALVGFSGAGKSTIAKLLPRFYDPSKGSIQIDGIDIRDATFDSLREQIGYVTQDNILFNRTVRENITFSRESFSDERVRDAARVAHAEEFIEAMPQGYDTMLSEAGVNISGGQKQRISIARAIMKDPAILILDEATSSLDTESETAIQKAIDEFVVGRTTIVIAHRLSTIQRADRIIVLSHGSIAEQGTHQELIELGGIYRRLHQLQFAEMPDPEDEEVA
ncbi:MAG: ABC transporter ATP-binding protein [Candidatus Hydrogenedentota bacterium]